MFTLRYVLNNDPEIEEEYATYDEVRDRINELRSSITACTIGSFDILASNDVLIQSASKL